jgi:hypothetical protein
MAVGQKVEVHLRHVFADIAVEVKQAAMGLL